MSNDYLRAKAAETAAQVCRKYDMDFPTAFRITSLIWEEARSSILEAVDAQEWQKLTLSDKALVCQEVVKNLLDRERLSALLAGERKALV